MNIEKLISQMTLEEKASLCSGADAWHTKEIKRLGIPAVKMSDGPHGLRVQAESDINLFRGAREAVCFPNGCALASSFDRKLAGKVGKAIGKEARAFGVQTVLGPAINMKRSPLCGRNFEYFSEDPYQAGELAAAYIQGMQKEGVGACAKHFAANNQEKRRMSISSEVSERAMREIYLPAFETAVKKGKPWALMCSYNRINGTYACEDAHLLTDILRKEWGFDGIVMTDWGAMNDRRKALLAGLNLEMPASDGQNDKRIVEAVKEGTLSEERLDEIVKELLFWIERQTENQGKAEEALDLEGDHDNAVDAATECAVLLKNEDGILPLEKGKPIVLIGGFAKNPRYQGGGSSHIHSSRTKSAVSCLAGQPWVKYIKGFSETEDKEDPDLMEEAKKAAGEGAAAVIFAGLPEIFESEGYDREHMDLPACQNRLIEEVAKVQPNTVVVLHNGSPVTMPWLPKVKAVLEMYLAGEGAGEAVVKLLFGEANPSGKLPETFPLRLSDTPCYLDFPGQRDKVYYREDVYVGYRYYDSREMDVLFPFGYGLSYTSFALEDLQVSQERIAPGQTVTVSVKVKNTGNRAGKEVVQLYVAPSEKGELRRPARELKGFEKVELLPGEEKEISFCLDLRAFSYYDEELKDWSGEKGTYTIQVGNSSRDLPLSAEIFAEFPKKPFVYQDYTTCEDVKRHFGDLKELNDLIQRSAFASLDTGGDAKMMEAMLADMPLHSFVSMGGKKEDVERLIEKLKKEE